MTIVVSNNQLKDTFFSDKENEKGSNEVFYLYSQGCVSQFIPHAKDEMQWICKAEYMER